MVVGQGRLPAAYRREVREQSSGTFEEKNGEATKASATGTDRKYCGSATISSINLSPTLISVFMRCWSGGFPDGGHWLLPKLYPEILRPASMVCHHHELVPLAAVSERFSAVGRAGGDIARRGPKA